MALTGTIAFIGAGNMAGALIHGLVQSGACQASAIVAAEPRQARRQELEQAHGITAVASNAEAAKRATVLLLATKPQVLPQVLPQVGDALSASTLVISVAAGVPISVIEEKLPAGTHVVRAMPNTPALAQMGATAIAGGQHATDADLETARAIFEAVGAVVSVEERLMDAVTGLSGSGPAYVFLFAEALIEAGVRRGLPREAARTLALQTLQGAAKLLQESGQHPAQLKEMVTSPAGTTAYGLHALEKAGFRATLLDAVEAAAARAGELGARAAAQLGKQKP